LKKSIRENKAMSIDVESIIASNEVNENYSENKDLPNEHEESTPKSKSYSIVTSLLLKFKIYKF
jgi:hypothetical protein